MICHAEHHEYCIPSQGISLGYYLKYYIVGYHMHTRYSPLSKSLFQKWHSPKIVHNIENRMWFQTFDSRN